MAAARPEAPDVRDALGVLCQAYWYPVYAYFRRWGHSREAAEDLVQGFFAHLLEKNIVAQADPGRGRFRSFLLSAAKHYAINEYERDRAQKRGGGRAVISLDAGDAESRYVCEPPDPTDPEQLFERRWALTVVDRARARLRKDFAMAGKAALFDVLQAFLTEESPDASYRDVALNLGMSEGAARVAVHRLRKRFRKHIERELVDTVAEPGVVDTEMLFLRVTLEAGGWRLGF
jgi:RNA polymerase sigma factor (sigma-70 family)